MSCGNTACVSTGTVAPAPNGAYVHQGAERLVGWLEAISGMLSRRRQRRALLKLDDHLLDDIGLTRDQADKEARKPFWK